jgi:hypothetical protein
VGTAFEEARTILNDDYEVLDESRKPIRLTVPAEPEHNLPARYNICSTQTIDTVIERNDKRAPVPSRFGSQCGDEFILRL